VGHQFIVFEGKFRIANPWLSKCVQFYLVTSSIPIKIVLISHIHTDLLNPSNTARMEANDASAPPKEWPVKVT